MKWLAAILMIVNVIIFLGVSDRQIESVVNQGDARPDVNKESMLLLQEVAPGASFTSAMERSAGIPAPNVSPATDLAVTNVATEDIATLNIDPSGAATVITADEGEESISPESRPTESRPTESLQPGLLQTESPQTGSLQTESLQSKSLETASLPSQLEPATDWSCYRIGPFKDKSLWRSAQNWVVDRGLGYDPVRSESRELRAVRVYVGPFESITAAQPAIENLKQRELDHFVYLKDGGQARISLGYFTQEELAVKFVDYLVSQKIEAKSQPEYRTLGPYDWMDVRISSGARGVLLSRDWGSEVINIDEQPCP